MVDSNVNSIDIAFTVVAIIGTAFIVCYFVFLKKGIINLESNSKTNQKISFSFFDKFKFSSTSPSLAIISIPLIFLIVLLIGWHYASASIQPETKPKTFKLIGQVNAEDSSGISHADIKIYPRDMEKSAVILTDGTIDHDIAFDLPGTFTIEIIASGYRNPNHSFTEKVNENGEIHIQGVDLGAYDRAYQE